MCGSATALTSHTAVLLCRFHTTHNGHGNYFGGGTSSTAIATASHRSGNGIAKANASELTHGTGVTYPTTIDGAAVIHRSVLDCVSDRGEAIALGTNGSSGVGVVATVANANTFTTNPL